MSFDPFGYQEPTPPASGGPGGGSQPPDFSPGGPGSTDASARAEALLQKVRGKVTLPGVFLIVLGVINLLPGAYLVVNTILINRLTGQQFQAQLEQMGPFMKKQFEELAKQGQTPEEFKNTCVTIYGVLSAVMLIASLLVIIGGIRMLQLRNFGLAVFASVVAAVPLISCLACCGPGEIVGIWSIIVLLSPEVRAAFR
jgi:hypothetical protein